LYQKDTHTYILIIEYKEMKKISVVFVFTCDSKSAPQAHKSKFTPPPPPPAQKLEAKVLDLFSICGM